MQCGHEETKPLGFHPFLFNSSGPSPAHFSPLRLTVSGREEPSRPATLRLETSSIRYPVPWPTSPPSPTPGNTNTTQPASFHFVPRTFLPPSCNNLLFISVWDLVRRSFPSPCPPPFCPRLVRCSGSFLCSSPGNHRVKSLHSNADVVWHALRNTAGAHGCVESPEQNASQPKWSRKRGCKEQTGRGPRNRGRGDW